MSAAPESIPVFENPSEAEVARIRQEIELHKARLNESEAPTDKENRT
jgi:hypothetical protein